MIEHKACFVNAQLSWNSTCHYGESSVWLVLRYHITRAQKSQGDYVLWKQRNHKWERSTQLCMLGIVASRISRELRIDEASLMLNHELMKIVNKTKLTKEWRSWFLFGIFVFYFIWLPCFACRPGTNQTLDSPSSQVRKVSLASGWSLVGKQNKAIR